MDSLKSKIAIVTGATSGIGKHIAERLAAAGARVAVSGIEYEQAVAVVDEITQTGGQAVPIRMDVTDQASVDEGFAHTEDALGPIDILISNAGIQIVSPLHQFSFDDWKRMMAVHLDGAFLTTQAALRSMYRDDRGGNVIYIGSAHSHMASVNKSAYVTAKHGLLGLARVLAKEGGPHNVRSFVICPGLVMTPLIEKQIPLLAKQLGISQEDVLRRELLKDTVDRLPGTVDEVAELALFLATQQNAALSGQSFNCGHGIFMS